MKSEEIANLLKLKENILERKDFFKILETSPQINEIRYIGSHDKFYLRTEDRYSFEVKVYTKKK